MPDGGRVLLTTDITDRREAEARFLAAAESIPDGLAIFDAEDRFVFFNSRYPAHLTDNLRQVLRLGMRFDDWLKEGLALGPIYHPDMGEDYVERRLALHAQDEYESEHKIIDGRWVRVRESRMADGGRVLLTTDVTERRRRQQQLSLLAMAVEQVGDQVEIADASGRCTYVNPAFVRLTGFAAGRGDRSARPGRAAQRAARCRVLRCHRSLPAAGRQLAGPHHQSPQGRRADLPGHDHLAAARRARSHHPLCRRQA